MCFEVMAPAMLAYLRHKIWANNLIVADQPKSSRESRTWKYVYLRQNTGKVDTQHW